MSLEGKLRLRVEWDGAQVRRATVESSRRPLAARALVGRPAVEVAARVSLLFSVCAQAQGAAAASACEAAAGALPSAEILAERELRVAGEAALEHLWRLLLDFPAELGIAPEPRLLAGLRASFGAALRAGGKTAEWRRFGAALDELLAAQVWSRFDGEPESAGLASWLDWARAEATPIGAVLARLAGEGRWGDGAVPLMPEDDGVRDALLHWTDDDFARRPHWRGEALETGALARLQDAPAVREARAGDGNTVFVRVLARVLELGRLAADIRSLAEEGDCPSRLGARRLEDGIGAAWVETARGRLMHFAAVDKGTVARYRMVAPTEWNFHPAGAFVRGAETLAATDPGRVERQVVLLARALDPCVPFETEVCNA